MPDAIPPPVVSIEELTAALAESLARERKLRDEIAKLRAAVNRWQMLRRGAMGTEQKVDEEMQLYLRDGLLPE